MQMNRGKLDFHNQVKHSLCGDIRSPEEAEEDVPLPPPPPSPPPARPPPLSFVYFRLTLINRFSGL